MIVVADTSPINCLLLIGCVDVLALIYQQVIVPQAVFEELNAAEAPGEVRAWLAQKPSWFEVSSHELTRIARSITLVEGSEMPSRSLNLQMQTGSSLTMATLDERLSCVEYPSSGFLASFWKPPAAACSTFQRP